MIIGLDLSVNSTGVCLNRGKDRGYRRHDVSTTRCYEYKIIVPKLSKRMKAINEMKTCSISHIEYDKIKDLDSHNIRCIANAICDIIKDMREKGEEIELVVIEDVAMAAKGRSIITLTLLNGYVRCMLDQLGLRYETVTPTQWKKEMLGNGQADKELIIYHWARFDQENCRHMMDMSAKCDDIADAYFLTCWGEIQKKS